MGLLVDPIFIQKPDPWLVTQSSDLLIGMAPVASELRKVKLGCTYRGCELFIEVPVTWPPERVQYTVATFRQRFK